MVLSIQYSLLAHWLMLSRRPQLDWLLRVNHYCFIYITIAASWVMCSVVNCSVLSLLSTTCPWISSAGDGTSPHCNWETSKLVGLTTLVLPRYINFLCHVAQEFMSWYIRMSWHEILPYQRWKQHKILRKFRCPIP